MKLALDYADALDCKLVHCHGGDRAGGRLAGDGGERVCRQPRLGGGAGAPAGVKLVIEPINHRDMPGYFLNTQAQGAAVVEAIGRDRLGLQFDVYHVQITEGDITKRMERYMPVIAHMQIADVPARNEPGTGEIGWGFVFRRMDELGYAAGSVASTARRATPWRGWAGGSVFPDEGPCSRPPAAERAAGRAWRRLSRKRLLPAGHARTALRGRGCGDGRRCVRSSVQASSCR